MSALVSVIVPAYNCEAWVGEAVHSALAQDHPSLEIIVVNDGSTDGTLGALRQFGDRIRIVDQKNAGPPAARNAGLGAARGDFIAFLDADDVWWPGKVSDQIAYLEAHLDVGTVITPWQVWSPDADGQFRRPAPPPARPPGEVPAALWCDWLYNRLLFDCELLTTTVLLRTSVVREVGLFDTGLWNGDDYDYWLRASRVARIAKLQRPGALYRVLPNSVSRRPREVNAELEVIERALQRWGRRGPDGRETAQRDIQRRLDQLTASHGWMHLQRGDPMVALTSFRRLLARDPMQPRVWAQVVRAAAKVVVQRTRGAAAH